MSEQVNICGTEATETPVRWAASAVPARPGRARLITAAKFFVTILVLLICASRVDFREVAHRVATMQPSRATAATVPFLLIPVFGGIRWWLALKGLGARIRFGTAVSLFSVAQMFGQVMPSLAGDGCRAWLVTRHDCPPRIAIQSILLERGCMVASLLVLLAATRPLLAARIAAAPPAWMVALLLLGVLGMGAALFWSDRLPLGRSRPVVALAQIAGSTRRVLLSRWGLGLAIVSLASNLNFVVGASLLAYALALPVTLTDCLAFIPLVTVATTLPISLGGWGVREGLLVVLLSAIGIPSSAALTLSLLFGLCGAASGVPGLMAWWLRQQPAARRPLSVLGG